MANDKTKQARDLIMCLLDNNEILPLETVYARCNSDFDAFAGALSSLIEKEAIKTGQLKTKNHWFIGNKTNDEKTTGEMIWYNKRGSMRHNLSKILNTIKKFDSSQDFLVGSKSNQQIFEKIKNLLDDGRTRSLLQITAETDVENLPSNIMRHFARLPDGRYTLPDSDGAKEYFWTYIREKPRRLTDLLRLLHKHKGIRADILEALNNQDQLIKLPRGLITTEDSQAGAAEIARRSQLKQCQDMLNSRSLPFFNLQETGLDRNIVRDIIDKYAIFVSFNGNDLFCLRRAFPGNIIKDQLTQLTGRNFTLQDQVISVPVFLKTVSMGKKEALNYLNIEECVLQRISQDKIIDTFYLDGRLRFWRNDMDKLRTDSHLLRDIIKDYAKYKLPQVAVMLGITTGQVRRLISEGKLKPTNHYKQEKTMEQLFARKDIALLQMELPKILYDWASNDRKKNVSIGVSAGKMHYPRRKGVISRELPENRNQKFQLDQFQSQAVDALQDNHSVLLSAPTGNGKTLVAEILARNLMANGNGMVYTSPLKALSNQKYRDFKDVFGADKVGLVTGDISVNSNAPLLIMTTEIFRNWCLGEPEQLANTIYVVFDEFHYLDDNERGTTWEESILFAPSHIKFLGLSATVPNIKEIAAWIGTVRKDNVIVIEEKKRQIPLMICWLSPNGQVVNENEAKQEVEDMIEYQKAFRSRKHWTKE